MKLLTLLSVLAGTSLAQNNCTISKDYPFFLYAFNYGTPVFTDGLQFFPLSSTSHGIAVNYINPSGSGHLYPTSFNITEKSNLISHLNDLGSKPYLNDPLSSNDPINFHPYNATAEKYGMFGLQTYNNNAIGGGACRVTVNREIVPFYLCPSNDGSGHLFVTYQAASNRFCIVIDLVAESEG